MIECRLISKELVRPFRLLNLPVGNMPYNEKYLCDDENETFHIGAFCDDKLVGAMTFALENNVFFSSSVQYRGRGMGVLSDYRKLGIGKKIVEFGLSILRDKNCEIVWFNARIVAVDFYVKCGFQKIGDIFYIENVGEHYLMYKRIK